MGSIYGNGIHINGNFANITKKRPKSVDKDYKIIIPYPFKWRDKLGKVECDCKEVMESYQPYYGRTCTHSNDCAMMKHLRRYPGIANLIEVSNIIAQD